MLTISLTSPETAHYYKKRNEESEAKGQEDHKASFLLGDEVSINMYMYMYMYWRNVSSLQLSFILL